MFLLIAIKTVHILSSTVLFGTGIGTAFQMLATHYRGDVHAIAVTARSVVTADRLMTTPAAVIQPATGLLLAHLEGWPWTSSWLIASCALYVVAMVCWFAVVGLQHEMATEAAKADRAGSMLSSLYRADFRDWMQLGWPAFFCFVGLYWLMLDKPVLW